MGSAGTRKHVYATCLAELLEVPYISMGSLVHQELSPHSSRYKKIANAVNEGKLVPEDIIFGLLSKRLEEGSFLMEILDQIAEIDLVVNFKCGEDSFVTKQFRSDVCSHCGTPFDAQNSESTSLNPCLATRTRHAQLKTSDSVDVEDSRGQNMHAYFKQVSGCLGETWRGLLAALHSLFLFLFRRRTHRATYCHFFWRFKISASVHETI